MTVFIVEAYFSFLLRTLVGYLFTLLFSENGCKSETGC